MITVLPLSKHLTVDSFVPSVVALEPSQASTYEESGCLDASAMRSLESVRQIFPMGDDIVVAGVLVPNPGVLITTKFCEFLTNLDSTKSRKTSGCLLMEKALREKCKTG